MIRQLATELVTWFPMHTDAMDAALAGHFQRIGFDTETGIIRKAGAWFTYEADQLGQGKENARTYLKKNPEVADEIETRILKHLGIGAAGDVPPGIDPVTGEVEF